MTKYTVQQHFEYHQRSWPSKRIDKAPIWCSVDLRDGNQALRNPMNPENKLKIFETLVQIGFKEIEISFPSASKTDYEFTRRLIENGHIPPDTSIQILTQARKHLIRKSFEALRDAPNVIIHLYNSTSPAQRNVVFKKNCSEIINLAIDSVRMIRDESTKHNGKVTLEYSPESFSQTEPDFACDICNAVVDAWDPQADEKVIINLPSTVEISTPNVFADQVEYVINRFHRKANIITSVHTHNDRGCAIAAAELAILAGAQRVEGTLFGNGERTGNTDLITLALNMFSQGIDSGLDFSDIGSVSDVYTECTDMTIHPRHPYAGELVFTAFSGSHQDAISKGLSDYNQKGGVWQVPYLPIDPKDIGRSCENIIRINSQSGKGGAAFILNEICGFQIPKKMYPEIGNKVKTIADKKGRELSVEEIRNAFMTEFVNISEHARISEYNIEESTVTDNRHGICINAKLLHSGKEITVKGKGNGLLDALSNAINSYGLKYQIISYHEHSIERGSNAKAVSYIELENDNKKRCFGAGIDTDIALASVLALTSALNRLYRK
ncbi:MAG TPA: 2-isopropylmalate synthase [Chitinispirillaceae bacterium]|nr:2-isopropylmalate synthase [Chitinispirillaceae bacterium]